MIKNLSEEIDNLKTSKEKYGIFNSAFKENLYYTNKITNKNNKNINNKSIISYIKNNIKNATYCLLLNIKIFNEQNSFLSAMLFLFLIILSLLGFILFIPIVLILILSLCVRKVSKQVVSVAIKLKKKIQPKYEGYKKKFNRNGNKDLHLLDYFLGFPIYLLNGVLVVFFQGSIISFSFFKKIMEKIQKGAISLNTLKDFLFINSSKIFQKNINNKKGKLITDSLKKENLKLQARQLVKTKVQKQDLTKSKQNNQLKKKELNKNKALKAQNAQQLKAINVSREKEKAKLMAQTKEGISQPVTMATPFKELFKPRETGESINKVDLSKLNNDNLNYNKIELNNRFNENTNYNKVDTNSNIGNFFKEKTNDVVVGQHNTLNNSLAMKNNFDSFLESVKNNVKNNISQENPNLQLQLQNSTQKELQQIKDKLIKEFELKNHCNITDPNAANYNPVYNQMFERYTKIDVNQVKQGGEFNFNDLATKDQIKAIHNIKTFDKYIDKLQQENQRNEFANIANSDGVQAPSPSPKSNSGHQKTM